MTENVVKVVEKFKYTKWISIAILVLGLVCGIVFGGLNTGIDFTGGSIITFNIGEEFDTQVIEDAITSQGVAGPQIVKTGEGWTDAEVRIQDVSEEGDQAALTASILEKIQETYPNAELGSEDRVGGTASKELVFNAFLTVIVACALMLVYIWIRFELFSGIAAVLALAHDVGVMIAFMAIFQLQINSSFIAACLTIVGYSINDTIVLLDRIRDNNKIMSLKKYTREQIANVSIKETIGRTLNTSITTLIMIVTLYIFGVTTIKDFAFPIIVGLVAGTYSSIFVAVPMATALQRKFVDGKYKRNIAKASKKKNK